MSFKGGYKNDDAIDIVVNSDGQPVNIKLNLKVNMSTHIPKEYVGTEPGNPLTGVLSSRETADQNFVVGQQMEINEDRSWQLRLVLAGGTPPYSDMKAWKSADDRDADGNLVWVEITDDWYVTDADSITFTSSGAIGNDRFYYMSGRDSVGDEYSSGVFDLDVIPADPGDPDTQQEFRLSGLIAHQRIAGASSGPYVTGDTIRVTYTARNGAEGNPLTVVQVDSVAPSDSLTGPASITLTAIDDSQDWYLDHVITAQEETDRGFAASAIFQSAETDDIIVAITIRAGANNSSVFVGFWGEHENAWRGPQNNPGTAGPIMTLFEDFTLAHTKGFALNTPFTDDTNPSGDQSYAYVVNQINKAREFGCSLELQLGAASDYGWNFSTGRGNFNVGRWKDGISRFAKTAQNRFFGSGQVDPDPVANAAICAAIDDGTIRYLFTIDEPMHKRWSPSWNGSLSSDAPGSTNYCTNEHLDEMSEWLKIIFADATQPINVSCRAGSYEIGLYGRTYPYTFQHMTHCHLPLASNRWAYTSAAGNRTTGNKDFEFWLTERDNLRNGYTVWNSADQLNLQRMGFVQMGFESKGNPRINGFSWKDEWWENQKRYPYNGNTSYIKMAPMEADFLIKKLLSERNPTSGILEPGSGFRATDDIMLFKGDRQPDSLAYDTPITDYIHYQKFVDYIIDNYSQATPDLTPLIGIPIDWDGFNPSEADLAAMWSSRDPIF